MSLVVALKEIEQALPSDAFSVDDQVLSEHTSSYGSIHPFSLPSCVVFPSTTTQVQAIVAIALKHKIPLIPTGGRTALEGQFLPLPGTTENRIKAEIPSQRGIPLPSNTGCISVSMIRMCNVLLIDVQSSTVRVQAGLKWKDLNERLAKDGIPLFWPVDPGLEATFGGMLAVGGSGTNAVRYGTMRGERVLNLEVVMPDASVIHTRGNGRARKSSLGFDLGRLLIGSEGTLGVITEATLRLEPVLSTKVGVSSFPTATNAINAVVDLSQTGISFQCLEYLDNKCMEAIIKSGLKATDNMSYLQQPTIFIKFQGSSIELSEDSTSVQTTSRIIKHHQGTSLLLASTDEENENIWNARKNIFHSYRAIVPKEWGEDWSMYTTDCCVPMSNLSKFIEGVEQIVNRSPYLCTTIAHAGDGNTHIGIFYHIRNDSYTSVQDLANAICKLAISLDGTSAGEHGVGLSKRHLLEEELGSDTVRWMRIIKNTIDPFGIMNPGKILPDIV